MSLWFKSPSDITFTDIDEFCQTKQPENHRLDYKVTIPAKLEKTIAAFANTLGGMILLGVNSDPRTNEPIWPPVAGMPDAKGLAEKIVQISRDAIYPPVRIEMSPVIANEGLPGHSLIVLRVDESNDAPHATDNRTSVYVYERTDNQNDPHKLADIDRIQHLLNRRQTIETEREAMIGSAINRALRHIPEPRYSIPRLWVSVIPFFPWRQICAIGQCRDTHDQHAGLFANAAHRPIQTMPGGTFAVGRRSLYPEELAASGYVENDEPILECCSINCKGHVFASRILIPNRGNRDLINFESVCIFAAQTFRLAKQFYGRAGVEFPGLVQVSIGMENVANRRMHIDFNYRGAPYPDNAFRADHTLPVEAFILENYESPPNWRAIPIFEQIGFGFDLMK